MKNCIMKKMLKPLLSIIFLFFTAYAYSSNIVYIFAHGLGATQKQADLFAALASGPIISFDFPDAKGTDQYDSNLVNLGQKIDMEALHGAYQRAMMQFPGYDVVFIGLSRGSATILNYMAHYKPKNVKALILESPFDTLVNLVEHLMNRFHLGFLPTSVGIKIAQFHFKAVDPLGIFPAESINEIAHDIPIIFIHAQNDQVVPIKSSRNLYCQLVKNGHGDVYLCEFADGLHGKLMIGTYVQEYINGVHAWLKKYHLPHNEQAAQQGNSLLSNYQPTIEEVALRPEICAQKKVPAVPYGKFSTVASIVLGPYLFIANLIKLIFV